jgi:DNA-directed RNA polymerase subunit delta
VGLDDFKDKNRDELSMIEVARAILEDHGKRMAFADIVNAVQKYLGKSDEEIRQRLPQFYTDLNTNGEFISMGENVWALRKWFPYESVDEEVNHPEDEEDDEPRKKHHKKVNAFLATAGDDDIIDYDNDDPEDDDLDADDDDEDDFGDDDSDYDDGEDDDESADSLPDGIEGQLSQLNQDDDDDDDDD